MGYSERAGTTGGTPQTNERYKMILPAGGGLSLAFDMPTLMSRAPAGGGLSLAFDMPTLMSRAPAGTELIAVPQGLAGIELRGGDHPRRAHPDTQIAVGRLGTVRKAEGRSSTPPAGPGSAGPLGGESGGLLTR